MSSRTRRSNSPSASKEKALSRLTIGVRVAHLLKSFARRAADALRGRIGRGQLGMLGFELLELLHQLVESGVGNFRIVQRRNRGIRGGEFSRADASISLAAL